MGTRCKQEAPSEEAQVRRFPPKGPTVGGVFENVGNDVYAELLRSAVSSLVFHNVGVFESFHVWVIEVDCRDYTECNHSWSSSK